MYTLFVFSAGFLVGYFWSGIWAWLSGLVK